MHSSDSPLSYEDDPEAGPSPQLVDPADRPWSRPRRFLLQAALAYMIIACWPALLSWIPTVLVQEIPGSEKVMSVLNTQWLEANVWHEVTPWVADNLLRLDREVYLGPTGSGDTTHGFIKLLVTVLAALLIALIWTAIEAMARWNGRYRILPRVLHVSARYYVAFFMLLYGSYKVIKLQFPDPGPTYLTAVYGESTPMRLLWFFMGQSEAYTMFAGAGEVLAGFLLLWRRTTTLGALVTVGVMSNVALMNYAYDVPVKIFSTQLLLIALVLVALDWRRIANVFVFNRTAPPADLSPLFGGIGMAIVRNGVKLVLIGALLYSTVAGRLKDVEMSRGAIANTPYYGLWEVETFRVDGVERPPLLTDAERWRYLMIEVPGRIRTRAMNNRISNWYGFRIDKEAGTIQVTPPASAAASPDASGGPPFIARHEPKQWTIEELEPDVLLLAGDLHGKAHEMRIRRRDLNDFTMVNRGFHWINEKPQNDG